MDEPQRISISLLLSLYLSIKSCSVEAKLFDFYDIVWFVHDKLVGKGPYYKYVVSIKDVSSPIFIHAELRTHREWHLSGQTDDWFKTYLGTILPPIEDLI